MKSFEWKILPFGRYKEYLVLVKNYNKHRKEFNFLLKKIVNKK